MSSATVRDLAALPKGHLHLHLEAAIRPETLEELSAAAGLPVPPTRGYTDFTAFAQMYGGLVPVLVAGTHLDRLIDEAVEDAAADGAAYVEFGVSPHSYATDAAGMLGALDRHLDLTAAASARHDVAIGLMVTIDRTLGDEHALAMAEIAAARAGRGVVSLGLANDEQGHPGRDFERAFAIARAAGLQSTPHAGELDGPEAVWEAIDILSADRVLHGIRATEDPRLVAELAARGIPLDICPTSNLLLEVIADLADHPITQLLAAGVRCSINADDPILFGPGILAEYEVARSTIGLSDEQLAACAWTSIETTLAPDAVKAQAKSAIEAWLAPATEVVR